MDVAQPEAEAVLVRNGRIVLVVSSDEVERAAQGARLFDAEARVVIPGFVELPARSPESVAAPALWTAL